MSKKWTPELDSILLHGVFEECQISFGKALCEKIAERVRAAGIEGFLECTPKAVENRLYSWKKKNASTAPSTTNGNGNGAGDAPPTTPKKAPRAKKEPATPKTPRAKKGAKKVGSEEEADGAKGKGMKRGKGSDEDEEGERQGEEKKVKLEAVDGEGEDEGMASAEEEV